MRKILIWSIITTVIFVVSFAFFIVHAVQKNEVLYTIFSGTTSIFATIAFGFWISYVFQKANERQTKNHNQEVINTIRTREFAKLSYHLSSLVRTFYSREDGLLHKIDGLRSSFGKDTIDIDNLTKNYFVFDEISKNITKYYKDKKEQDFIKKNIDVLFMRDTFHTKFIESAIYDTSETFEEFSEFNDECIRLFAIMEKLNLDRDLEIFSKEEIKAIGAFRNKINIGWFLNFNPPFEIIKLFELLIPIEKFLNSDFVPAYKKETFWADFEKLDQEQKEYENKVRLWEEENRKKAIQFLEKNKEK